MSPLGFFTIAMKAARAASSPHATAAMLPLGNKSYHTGSIPDLNIRMGEHEQEKKGKKKGKKAGGSKKKRNG